MRVVYVDVLFGLNALMDYLLLVLTARLSGVWQRRVRLVPAAVFGGLAAVALYFPHWPLWASLLSAAAVCAGMTALAFGFRREFGRLCALLTGISLALGGGVTALSLLGGGVSARNGAIYFDAPLRRVLPFALLIWLLLGIGGGRAARVGRTTARLCVTLGGRSVVLRALCDSGNLLRDPVTGKKVALVSAEDGAPLLPQELRPMLRALRADNAAEVCTRLTAAGAGAFRLMPMHTAAGSSLLLVLPPDRLEIDGSPERGYLLGLSPCDVAADAGCRAIIGA